LDRLKSGLCRLSSSNFFCCYTTHLFSQLCSLWDDRYRGVQVIVI
jgi:hypothetical protein